LLAAVTGMAGGGIFVVFIVAGVIGSVSAAVHHAEVVAHRVGEPYGTLVLALAVTLIEVALIVSLMFAGQLLLIAIVSLVIYGAFVFTQTVGHREFFLQEVEGGNPSGHAAAPGNAATALSGVLLLLCLVTVVLLAKKLAPSLEAAVQRLGAPIALVGVLIAAIVLLPEGLAALRTGRTIVLHGIALLVIFIVYLFTTIVP
jgi:Ca2+:H+ antiporter